MNYVLIELIPVYMRHKIFFFCNLDFDSWMKLILFVYGLRKKRRKSTNKKKREKSNHHVGSFHAKYNEMYI